MTESIDVRLTIDLSKELADRLTKRLRWLLIEHVGDATDDDGWDAATASLSALVARSFDRQTHPIAELADVAGDDLFEDYVTFGEVIE